MKMEINIRNATLEDIPFLVETIIEAEKSGTSILSYTTIFGLVEEDAKKYIALMLEEEIDGCELSVSAFLLAEYRGETVGAICAWIEGLEGVSSTILKGNLLRYVLPQNCFETIRLLNHIINELHIDYKVNTIQIGLVYVTGKARGQGLAQKLISKKIEELKGSNLNITNNAYVQVFGHNLPAIKAYEKLGFQIIENKIARNLEITKYLPSDSKLLMKLNIK